MKRTKRKSKQWISAGLIFLFSNFVCHTSYFSYAHSAIPKRAYRAEQIRELDERTIRDLLKEGLSHVVKMADEVQLVTVSAMEARQLLSQLPTWTGNGEGIGVISGGSGLEARRLLAQAGVLTISGFHIESPTFKSYLEHGTVSYYLSKRARVTVSLLDPEYNQVREIVSEVSSDPGMNTVSWDGRDGTGRIIKEGKYHYQVFAMDEAGHTSVLFKPVWISVDAPRGTELKGHINNIPGKTQK